MGIAGATPLGALVDPLSRRKTPNDLGAAAWWDFSEVSRDGFGVWQDTAGTTAVVNNSVMKRCDDRSGNGYHVTNSVDSSALWSSTTLDQYGGGDFTSQNAGYLANASSVAASSAAWSGFIVCHLEQLIENGGINNRSALMGSTGDGAPVDWHIGPFHDTGASRFYRVRRGNIGGAGPDVVSSTLLWTGSNNRYYSIYWEVDGSSSKIYLDNVLDGTGAAWQDAEGPGDITLGADGNNGSGMNSYILEAGIFDKKLSTVERTNLYNYHNSRYGLDGQ